MKQYTPMAWFEIVTTDLKRATAFYQSVCGAEFTHCEMGPISMAIFVYPEGQTGGALVHGECYKNHQPGNSSTIIYLNADAIATTLAKVEQAGGTIVFPCMDIGENGYIAMFIDTEGNSVGIWSAYP